ncbi:MAG TPA: hypothetical protein VF121_02720 [Thermoanaerobaculia bacterium]|nr:hypothetical protein [Thermoanaerobaculia bacterium]
MSVSGLAAQGPRPIVEKAVGDAESDLLFVPLAPCRVIDTRFGGGPLAAGETRPFEVAGTANFPAQGGTAGGCGVPLGATTPLAAAAVLNFVAVGPAGPGHMTAWEFGQPIPGASTINYAAVPGLNIANGVIVPIAGVSTLDKDLNIQAAVSAVHVVVDVTGYFTRFPLEQFQNGLKSEVVATSSATLVDLDDGACHELLTCTVTAPALGKVVVEAWTQVVVNHTSGITDRFVMQVETAGAVSCPNGDSVDASDYEIPGGLGTNPDVDFTLSHGRAFTISNGQTVTYRLSGQMVNGAAGAINPDQVENSRMLCTFIPD